MLAMFDNSARREHEAKATKSTATLSSPAPAQTRTVDGELRGFPGPYAPVGVTR